MLAVLALASTIARADAVRLLAPAHGATLRGGSVAELHWSGTSLPAAAEEWEAFLSVDGGRYYAFRVTPHLDIELQRFTFVVPNVETRDARILIRVGDEKRETGFEARERFSIVRDPDAEENLPEPLGLGEGEAAREGDRGVLAWTEGARNGSGLRQRSSSVAHPPAFHSLAPVQHETETLLSPGDSDLEDHPSCAPLDAPRPQTSRVEKLARSVDLLLLCRRRNI